MPPFRALSAFGSADFRLFVGSRLLSLLLLQMVSVAVGWQVYGLTHRPLDLGYVGLAQFLPAVGFGLVTGHAADRFDRRRIARLCHAAFALSACALALLARSPSPTLVGIYAVLLLLGTARAFNAPAAQALMPSLVPATDFHNAFAWSSSGFQVATIVGPAVGGLVYALTGGASAVYLIAAALGVLDLALLLAIRARTGRMERRSISWSTLLAGIRYVLHNKIVLGVISLDLFAVLLGGATALMPIFAQDILHTGPWGLGLLRSAPALGAATVGLFLAARPPQRRTGPLMLVCVAIFGAATVAFGLSRALPLSLLALVVMGASDMVSVFVRLTLVQISPAPEMRGRVNAVNMLFIGASNELGEFESGLTAQWLGAVPAVLIGGLGTLLVVALWTRVFPELRAVDRLPTG